MMESIAIATAFVVVVVAGFAACVRLGMLVGLRIDRVIEARREDEPPAEPATGAAASQPRNREGRLGE